MDAFKQFFQLNQFFPPRFYYKRIFKQSMNIRITKNDRYEHFQIAQKNYVYLIDHLCTKKHQMFSLDGHYYN